MSNILPLPQQHKIKQEAREWLIRFDGDQPPTSEDIAALRNWVNQSHAHKEELERIAAFWNEANILSQLAIPLQKTTKTHLLQKLWRHFQSRWLSVSAGVLTVACLLLIGVTFWLDNLSPVSKNGVYVTEIGELKVQKLADGSQMYLNTDSQVNVDYDKTARTIRLLRGEAHFSVAKDPSWPFIVYANGSLVRAVGTAFTVRLNEEGVKVTVTEGKVDLANLKPDYQDSKESNVIPEGKLESASLQQLGSLSKGQYTTMTNPSVIKSGLPSKDVNKDAIQIQSLSDQELNKQMAWQEGYLVFAGDPLINVVEELHRYTPVTIEILDPALRELRIGGRFKVGNFEALYDVLTSSFNLEVIHQDDQHILVQSPRG